MGRDRTFSKHQVTFAAGQTVTGTLPLGVESIMAISSASSGASWTAAVLAFEWTPDDGTTWIPVFDDGGTEISIPSAQMAIAAPGRLYVNAAIIAKLAGLSGKVRLCSGPAGARVAQVAAATITLITKTP